MRTAALGLIATLCATIAHGQESLSLTCTGDGWKLDLADNTAQFFYPERTPLEVMLDTPAEGRDWPRALTLVGERDTAVLIVEPRACEHGALTAEVLTQRGTLPVLLTGCCELAQ